MLSPIFTALLAIFIAIAPVLAAEAPAKSPANRPVRDKWALVVGIGSFQNSTVPKLKYAAKDARDFRNYLVSEANFAPDHVRLLVDDAATQRRVLSELGTKFLARVAKPDDLVVLFFSTHGSPAQADIRGKNFLVAYDSDPEDLYTTGLEMDKVVESVKSRILSDRVLLVLDACHSGAVSPGAKGLIRTGNFDSDEIALGCGQMVICSSEPDERSWESKRYQNGVFTKNFLDVLRRNGNRAPLGAAFPLIQKNVSSEVQEDYAARQKPKLASKWDGNELVLSVRPADPQPLPKSVLEILEPDSTNRRQASFIAVTAPPVVQPKIIKPQTVAPPKVIKPVAVMQPALLTTPVQSIAPRQSMQSPSARVSPPARAVRSYSGNRMSSQDSSPDDPHLSKSLALVKSSLPRINPYRRETPTLVDIISWSLQDQANYVNEAIGRRDQALQNLTDAQEMLKRVQSQCHSIVPSSREYGESEESFKSRHALAQAKVRELEAPYVSEVETRNRILSDENSIVQTCTNALQKLQGNYH
jgi:hypothetical protein